MDAFHCIKTLKIAVNSDRIPEIFNSDQESLFTYLEIMAEFRTHGIQISINE